MAGRRTVAAGAAIVALALAGACGGERVVTIAEFERASGVAAPVQPDPEAVRRIAEESAPPTIPRIPELGVGTAEPTGAPPPQAEAAPIGFGDGGSVVATALAGVGGDASLVEVVLYDGYGIATTYQPSTGNFDRVVVRGGGAELPDAVPDTMVDDPEASRFGPADVDWSIVPGLVERTPTDLGVAGGRVSHVLVEKNLPFTPDLVIRVYVTAERGGGRIDYFADGRPMRAFPD